ncbi:helix-turn-helix domain-containing protein [Mesorhizobium sp. M7A.F.Ca.US.008.03.1.1]|uniref:helix-turn-helix domain-containing protein n=1 Tax=Mesorhizobium sp. M7A.F.Ca.US.008.03.1.1 TaxID=2496742 RepID=UPI000FCA091C|nr:helix-turn-helix domain-containing protein [Mesorhizobium sp. M7A.F.Ca.US.008.03.1.1]RUW61136.1 sigma-54-dependent Fis family transcriptional regulator [Mesorhizobium sp. M7A.F.Ca.US.008.03.1.1]
MNGHSAGHHEDRVQTAINSDAAAKSALIASWQRSSNLHRLDPAERKSPKRLTEAELRTARQRIEPLQMAARSSLDKLYLAVGGVGCCVLLADLDGVPVDRRGAASDNQTFEDWGLWTGTVWGEESEGTNGIGTCLAERRALTIHRDQHFFARNTLLSCTTAPIFDHEGNLTAALDVSSCRADLTEAFTNLISVAVADAARRIEAENFRRAFQSARVLLLPETSSGLAGLIAVDSDDLVVGATRSARIALGISQESLARSLPAMDVLSGAEGVEGSLGRAERAALQRALARTSGNISAAADALGISRATLHRKLKRFELGRTH